MHPLLMQAAVYVVMKFPARGTMLDLVNALAHQLVCRVAVCCYTCLSELLFKLGLMRLRHQAHQVSAQ